MDATYDRESAATLLRSIHEQQIIQEIGQSCELSDVQVECHQISATQRPACLRIIHAQPDEPRNPQETVLRVQGILVQKNLPPIIDHNVTKRSSKAKHNYAQTAQQAICLSGLGLDFFHQSIINIVGLHGLFERHVPQGKLRAWHPERIDGNLTISAKTRYFTLKRHANVNDTQDFQPWVDEDGFLKDIQGNAFVHTVDNVVEYFGIRKEPNNVIRYVTINPLQFQIGDIVEASIAFRCVPVRDGEHQMLISLRGLALLDDTHRKAACAKRIEAMISTNSNQAGRVMKRKAVYTDEDEKRLNNMVEKMVN